MTFMSPAALLLLVAIPLVVYIAWPRRTRQHRTREFASLIVRSLIIALLVLALAGSQWISRSDAITTIFLLDVSDSVTPPQQEAGISYIRQALTTMGPEDQVGLISFGADALVERPASSQLHLDRITSVPKKNYTNIAGAIRLGSTLFPANTQRRLIILSDGAANLGDARQAAQIAKASGVQISVLPLPGQHGIDARLETLQAPSVLHQGEQFDLTVNVHSSAVMQAPLQIFSQGQLIAQQTLALQTGDNAFIVPLSAGAPGFTTFQAKLLPPQDTHPQNNTIDTFSEVQGPLSVLLVANHIDEGQPLANALQATGINVTQIEPAKMPSDLGRLSQISAIILVNVPSFQFAPRQLTLLQSYVRDLGGGLVVVGGDESYGPGGYFQTPLEETLPINMTIDDKQRMPGMTLLTVIDKSGSMADAGSTTMAGPRKVELAKEAIYRSVDLLVPWDRIGVIGFDNAARWVLEPTPAVNIQLIKDAVGTIRADGGTDILAGLQAAATAIVNEPSLVRHIVLLTDGGADPTGIPELTAELAEQGVTVSVIAIGQGYAPFLETVAEIGGGRFHFADDASVIPQIFAHETALASRSYLVEESFQPQISGPSPILQNLTDLPVLHGYVATSPKLTAQVILRAGTKQDPLLAQWQYGLGRAVAWTSDAKGQWANDWVLWPDFPRFWSQLVRWTIVDAGEGGLESQVTLVGDEARLSVEVSENGGEYWNNLDVNLSLIKPELDHETLPLPQTAPGLYQGTFWPDDLGIYLLHISGAEDDNLVASQTRGFVMSYSPEYRLTNPDPNLLPDLAKIGEGQILSPDTPVAAFAHTLPPVQNQTDIWPWLLLAAVLLLPLDVGLRRVMFGQEDVRRIWLKIADRLPQRTTQPKRAQPQPQPSSAEQLLKVKKMPKVEKPVEINTAGELPVKVPPHLDAASNTPEPAQEISSATEPKTENTVRRLIKAKEKRNKSAG